MNGKYLLFLVFLFVLACSEPPLPRRPLPIMVWFGPVPAFMSQTDMDMLADAGFTHAHFSPSRPERIDQLLTFADSAGLSLIIDDTRIRALVQNDSLLAVYQKHPAFGGLHLADRPGVDDISPLRAVIDTLQLDSANVSWFVNLYPNYASPSDWDVEHYSTYLNAMADSLPLDFLSVDHFGIIDDTIRHDYYRNLDRLRRIEQRTGTPFWGMILNIPFNDYPVPAAAHLRLQAFSALAYGAKGVQYFAFHPPEDTPQYDYGIGMTDQDGNLTRLYQSAIEVNAELARIGPELMVMKSTGVYHSDPAPLKKLELPPGLPVTWIDAPDVLAGFFENPLGENYVLLVNSRISNGATVDVYFSEQVDRVWRVGEQGLEAVPWLDATEHSVRLLFKAGDGELFKVEMN